MRALVLAALFCATSALAQQSPPFGPMTILVGFAAGQSADSSVTTEMEGAGQRLTSEPPYDQAAKFYAAHLGRFLPGKPSIDVRLVPGAGSLVAARRMLEAKADGTTIAMLGPSAAFAAITGEGGGFDAEKIAWIGARERDDDVCVSRIDAPVSRAETFTEIGAFTAALTAGSRSWIYARALNQLAGAKLKIIAGYASGFEVARALETGETDVWCGWSISALRTRYPDWLRAGKARLLVQFSRVEGGALAIPRASDLPKDPFAREAMQVLERQTRFQAFALAASTKLPPERLETLRSAYLAMLRDPGVLQQAGRLGLGVEPVPGGELQDEAAAVHAASPQARALLKSVLRGP